MKPTERFSSRVENYIKYRPHYPKEILEFLKTEIGLTPNWVIADIGSGTGISSELFLKNGNKVYDVEPNKEEKEFDHEQLLDYNGFRGRLLSSSYVPEKGHLNFELCSRFFVNFVVQNSYRSRIIFFVSAKSPALRI
jgi:hypothetical protein